MNGKYTSFETVAIAPFDRHYERIRHLIHNFAKKASNILVSHTFTYHFS